MSCRVLVVTHNYPRFDDDPAGAFVAALAEATVGAGWDVQVLAPHAPGTPENEVRRGVPVTRFRYAPERFERAVYVGDVRTRALVDPLRMAVFGPFLMRFWRAAKSMARRMKPDIVHAHWWIPGGLIASRLGRPFLITSHGSDVRLIERWKLARRVAAPVFRAAGAATTVSDFLAQDLVRVLGAGSLDARVVRMPVDVERFGEGFRKKKASPPKILYAGNLVESKGLDILLRAMKTLMTRRIPCRLKILGEGPAIGSLKRLASSLEIDNAIDWSPFVNQARMPTEYGESTVTVLPSRAGAEGLGLALVEALLAGCAVVGTRVGGIPEVIEHEVSGLLADDGDVEDLARQLERMLTESDLRMRVTETGRFRMTNAHAPEKCAQQLLDIYSELASR